MTEGMSRIFLRTLRKLGFTSADSSNESLPIIQRAVILKSCSFSVPKAPWERVE